ncbi:carotenoid oxygenase family protein [Streptomyces sp. MBT65]|uniref:carotenoid oxygenase family protein n=1 Tax=Streptomyces sp. MBT65 TaxID=1488395 RepID=UPI001F3E9546|nr:carotenoid oxygenase family protein [Streptomyces sp. MBT65]
MYRKAYTSALAKSSRTAPAEAVFVPAKDGTDEDAGWLVSLVSDDDGAAGELLVLVLDASDLSVRLPDHTAR